LNTERHILNRLNRTKKGVIFFTQDFSGEFSLSTIRKAFQRLVEKGKVRRIANGIYVRPEQSEFIGEVLPSAEEVALAIAKRDKATIVPSGALALNQLGLTTQVPLNLVYLTDGSARNITVGNRTIKFKKTAPKKLSAKGELSGMAILALQMLGKNNLDEERKKHLIQLLKKENKRHLEHDIKLAPAWISELLKKAL
jgi:DNA-binding GntR family transcriptional regulator